jgi:hypothetical protein
MKMVFKISWPERRPMSDKRRRRDWLDYAMLAIGLAGLALAWWGR